MKNDVKPYLAIGVLILGFAYFFFAEDPNDQILIAIVGWGGMVLGYYFGSSSGTAKKDETINNLTNKKMPYIVASLTQTEAEDLAKDLQPAFKLGTTNNYYTYTDIAPTAPTTSLSNIQNEGTYIMELDAGGGIVLRKRKMFPR